MEKIIDNKMILIGGTTGYDPKNGQMYTREVLFNEKTKERYFSKIWVKNIYITKTIQQLEDSAKRYYDVVELNKKCYKGDSK